MNRSVRFAAALSATALLALATAMPALADPGEKGIRMRGGEPRAERPDDVAPSPRTERAAPPRFDRAPARSTLPAPAPVAGETGMSAGSKPAAPRWSDGASGRGGSDWRGEGNRRDRPGWSPAPPVVTADDGGPGAPPPWTRPARDADTRTGRTGRERDASAAEARRRWGEERRWGDEQRAPGAPVAGMPGRDEPADLAEGIRAGEPDERTLPPGGRRPTSAWGSADRRPLPGRDPGPSDPEERQRWLETDSSQATWRERAAIAEARQVSERDRRRAEEAARRYHADSARALRWHWANDPRWRFDIRFGFYDPFWRSDPRWGWYDPRWGWDPRWGYDPRWGWSAYFGRGYDWYWGVSPRTAIREDPLLRRWALDLFDRDRDGRLGPRETDRASWALLRVADLNGNGRLDGREIAFARSEIRRFGWDRFRWDDRWERDWNRPGWREDIGWNDRWGWDDRPGWR
jgi:hypothetical protein